MGVPKRKTSKMRLRIRKAANRWHLPQINYCPQCRTIISSHTLCHNCGCYKGRSMAKN